MKLIADISLWWSIPLFILCGAIAVFFYYFPKNTLYSSRIRTLLTSLRGLGLFLISLLLLGIYLSYTSYREEKPILFVALDESESMLNYADSLQIRSELPKKIEQLTEQFGDKYIIKPIGFGESISDTLSYKFPDKKTDISSVFENIHENYVQRNLGAIILISDGNYNEGTHPAYSSKKLDFVPIFTVGVGDTILRKDLAIQTVFANDVAFSGAIFPIEVEGIAQQFNGKSADIKLFQNGNLIESNHLTFDKSSDIHFSHQFQVTAKGKGYQRFTVEVSSSEKEHTYINNQKSIYIEIIDKRNKILLISNGIHPDIGAINSVLKKDNNVETQTRFASELSNLPECDLVIFHAPTSPFSEGLWKQIYSTKKPVLILLGSNLSNNGLAKLNIGVSGASSSKSDRVQGEFNPSFSLIDFSEQFKNRLKTFPPLIVSFANSWTKWGNTLLYQKMDNVVLQRQLISLNNLGEQKIGVIYGDGLWSWRLSEQVKYGNSEAFDELISKLIQYLSVKQNTSKLRVSPPKNATTQDEIIFRSEFYNDAFQLITTPEIQLNVMNEKKRMISSTVFSKNENDYQLNLGRFEAGKYTWKASTTFGDKSYEKEGEFVVTDISLESLNLNSDFTLLNELASSTKGAFYPFKNWNKMIKDLERRDEISSIRYQEVAMNDLLDYKFLFFIIILLFALEWTIKRWFGAY